MPFDEALAARVRACLARRRGVEERALFGCAWFLLGGYVFAGVWEDSLVARVGPAGYEDALLDPHVREFDITGRPMRGWVRVEPEGIEDDGRLADWVQRALNFVSDLPRSKAGAGGD